MPVEKRRTRQQRVRHEAGDYTPSSSEVKKEDNKLSTPSSVSEYKKPANEPNKNKFVNSSNTCDQAINKNDLEQKKQTKNTRSNVAFAEEKQYQPVSIMESKNPTEGSNETGDPQKYRRREVISNWLRYEEVPPDEEPEDGSDYMLGEDFSSLLNLSESTKGAGFLQLKGERSWGLSSVQDSAMGADDEYVYGALKISELAAAMSTIPLHERLRIPESALPIYTVNTFKSDAETSQNSFEPNKSFVSDVEINNSFLEKLKLKENSIDTRETDVGDTSNICDRNQSVKNGHECDINIDNQDILVSSVSTAPEIVPTTVQSEKRSREEKVQPKFDFGLKKLENGKQSVLSDVKQSSDDLEQTSGKAQNSSQEVKLPKDEPISAAQEPNLSNQVQDEKPEATKVNTDEKSSNPVQLSASEVENLESWLDSVLDD